MAYQYYKPSFANIQEPVYDLPLELIMQQGNQMQETYYKNKSLGPAMEGLAGQIMVNPADVDAKNKYIQIEYKDKLEAIKNKYNNDFTNPLFGVEATAVINRIANDNVIKGMVAKVPKRQAFEEAKRDPRNWTPDPDAYNRPSISYDEDKKEWIPSAAPDGYIRQRTDSFPIVQKHFGQLHEQFGNAGIKTLKGMGETLNVLEQDRGIYSSDVKKRVGEVYGQMLADPFWKAHLEEQGITDPIAQDAYTKAQLDAFGMQQTKSERSLTPLPKYKQEGSGSGTQGVPNFAGAIPTYSSIQGALNNTGNKLAKDLFNSYIKIKPIGSGVTPKVVYSRFEGSSTVDEVTNSSSAFYPINKMPIKDQIMMKSILTQLAKKYPTDLVVVNSLNNFASANKRGVGLSVASTEHIRELLESEPDIVPAFPSYVEAGSDPSHLIEMGINPELALVGPENSKVYSKLKAQDLLNQSVLKMKPESEYMTDNNLEELANSHAIYDVKEGKFINTATEFKKKLESKGINVSKDGTYSKSYQASVTGKLNPNENYFASGEDLSFSDGTLVQIGGSPFIIVNPQDYNTKSKQFNKTLNDIRALQGQLEQTGAAKVEGKSNKTSYTMTNDGTTQKLYTTGNPQNYSEVNLSKFESEAYEKDPVITYSIPGKRNAVDFLSNLKGEALMAYKNGSLPFTVLDSEKGKAMLLYASLPR